jgi:hypothetical protein
MMKNTKTIFSVAALCAAGILALGAISAEAWPGQGSMKGMGCSGRGMLSWSQQEEMRKGHETMMQQREAHMQALGKVLFAPEAAPAEGQIFAPEAIKKAQPMMEQMFMEKHKAFQERRNLLTRDQQNMMMQGMKQGMRRMGETGTRSGGCPGQMSPEARGMGMFGEYVENALGLTPTQKEAFRKSLEVDEVTLKKHQEARETFFQGMREGTLMEEQIQGMARDGATFWGECMERMNGAVAKLYPTFSESQKEAFAEMRERMAENMEAGIFMAPHRGGSGMKGSSGRGDLCDENQRGCARKRDQGNQKKCQSSDLSKPSCGQSCPGK